MPRSGSAMRAVSGLAVAAATIGRAAADEAAALHCPVAVVGGGWGGAYFAYRMCVDSATVDCADVCVFEANARLGGRAYSTRIEDDPTIKVDVGPYRLRSAGAPTSSGREEVALGVTEDALGLATTGYTTPDDPSFRVVDDGLGNNAGFNVPIVAMLDAVAGAGGRVFTGQRAAGPFRSPGGSAHPLVIRFDTGDIDAVSADLVFLNTPWASLNQMDPTSALFADSNQTARECVEMITGSSVSAKYYVQYEDAWWVTKLGLTEGSFSADGPPRLAGRYHDGPLRCVDRAARKPLTRREVNHRVAHGRAADLECSGCLLATYVFSNAGFWLDYQANISDAQTRVRWTPADGSKTSVGQWRRRGLRGEGTVPPRVGRRDPAELLREYHAALLDFHADDLEAAGYSPADIDPPTWGYQGNWNSVPDLDAISATSPGSGSWPNPRPGGMTRPEVLRYLMKPVADLPLFLGNVDSGAYGAWAEGSLITTERVLAFHLGVEKPSWLSPEYYEETVLTMDVSKGRQAEYDAQKLS